VALLLLLLGRVELNLGPTISARSTPRDALSLGMLTALYKSVYYYYYYYYYNKSSGRSIEYQLRLG